MRPLLLGLIALLSIGVVIGVVVAANSYGSDDDGGGGETPY